jgi:hypothetical protein
MPDLVEQGVYGLRTGDGVRPDGGCIGHASVRAATSCCAGSADVEGTSDLGAGFHGRVIVRAAHVEAHSHASNGAGAAMRAARPRNVSDDGGGDVDMGLGQASNDGPRPASWVEANAASGVTRGHGELAALVFRPPPGSIPRRPPVGDGAAPPCSFTGEVTAEAQTGGGGAGPSAALPPTVWLDAVARLESGAGRGYAGMGSGQPEHAPAGGPHNTHPSAASGDARGEAGPGGPSVQPPHQPWEPLPQRARQRSRRD